MGNMHWNLKLTTTSSVFCVTAMIKEVYRHDYAPYC